jgi:hypothetical protein
MLSVILGLFSIPMLGSGAHLFVCFARIHTSNQYYVDYPYMTAAMIWLAVGLLNLWATLYGVWRRSFRGSLLAITVIAGLAANEIAVNHTPHVASLGADIHYLSRVRSSLDASYENHRKYPSSEAEFRNAIGLVSASPYKQHGNSLPYDVVIVRDAKGPRLTDISQRPAVLYYCVSNDLQEFWVTMTRLESAMASTAQLELAKGLPQEFWVYHGVGRDRSRESGKDSNP